jgi:hypothetical protein
MQASYSPEQKAALLREVLRALIDAVKAGGDLGAPGGVMYAAVTGKLSLAQFETAMAALVKGGYLRKQGELYFWVRDL